MQRFMHIIVLYVYMFICFLFDSRLGFPSIVLEKDVGMESFKKNIHTKKINADNIFSQKYPLVKSGEIW